MLGRDDVEASSQPDIGEAGETGPLHDALKAAGVKSSMLGELASALEAWKSGDDSALSALASKPKPAPKLNFNKSLSGVKDDAVAAAMGTYEDE